MPYIKVGRDQVEAARLEVDAFRSAGLEPDPMVERLARSTKLGHIVEAHSETTYLPSNGATWNRDAGPAPAERSNAVSRFLVRLAKVVEDVGQRLDRDRQATNTQVHLQKHPIKEATADERMRRARAREKR